MRFSVIADCPAIDWLDAFLAASAIERIQIESFEQARNGTPIAAWPILGIVTARAGDQALVALSQDIFPAGLRDDAVFALSGSMQSAEFHAWVVQRAAEFARLALRENGNNLKALAEVRTMLHEHQLALARLEALVAALPEPHDWTALTLAGDEVYFTIEDKEAAPGSEADIVIAQVVPQVVRFPVGIALMLRRARPGRGGLTEFIGGLLRPRASDADLETNFKVRAISRWSRTTLGEWVVSVEALEPHWSRFALEIDAFGTDDPIEIAIEVPASLSGRVAIGLAAPMAVDEFVMTLNGRKVGERPLALQVFEGIPGRLRRSPLAPTTARGDAPATGGKARVLSTQQLQSATLYEAPKVPAGYAIVNYLGDQGGVLVHPTGVRPTIAVIRNVEAGGARTVSAQVRHVAESGTPAECAIYAVESAASRKSADVVFDKARLAELTWRKVQPQQAAELRYELAEGIGSSADIFLLSRSPTSKINSPWSVFTAIRIGA